MRASVGRSPTRSVGSASAASLSSTRSPDHSTLKKTAKRCGPTAVEALNEALLKKAAENRVLKTNRLRADTTCVPADVGYPTDSGLMARGVVRLGKLVGRLHSFGLATRTKLRDRSRSMRRRAHDIGAWLRRRTGTAKQEAKAITGQMADIAEASLAEARRVAANARRGLRRAGDEAPAKAFATLAELETLVSRLGQVVAQARLRLSGEMPEGATRLVSLHDPDARPIKKGCIGKPVEFGYVGQVVDNEDGVVVDHSLHTGNPFDGLLLAPALRRVTSLARRAPRAVTADRGYGDAKVDKDLTELGVSFVAIIRKGRQNCSSQPGAKPTLQEPRQVADRLRGEDPRPQALLGVVEEPDGRARRRQGLVRLRHLRQQQPEN